MTVNVTLDFPPELENRIREASSHLEADVKEAYILDLFRQGRLSHFELSQVLGLDRFQTDTLLKRRGIFEGSLTAEDLDQDRRTLDAVFGKVC